MKGTLHEERNTFLIISRSVPKKRNVSDKTVETLEIHTHFVFYNFFFFENSAVCEIMWKNIADTSRHCMLDT